MNLKQRIILFLCLFTILLSLQTGFAQRIQPPPLEPPQWTGLIGTYVYQDEDRFYLREDQGRLEILFPLVDTHRNAEKLLFNDKEYEIIPLKETEMDTFQLSPISGLKIRRIHFLRDNEGFSTTIDAGKIAYKRSFYGPEKGKPFRIQPLKPIEELYLEAMKANPPVEKGDFLKTNLIEVVKLDSSLELDIRYATEKNFMGTSLYSQPRAFLQRPVAEALVRVHKKLKLMGFGLIIYDAYRPWYVTKMFWDATPNPMKNFVADPQKGSRHNRGCAVDVGLYDLATQEPMVFGGDYDEFSERSSIFYPGGTSRERWFREILCQAMEAEEFEVYEDEWWHFDYKEWKKYSISNLTFEEIR